MIGNVDVLSDDRAILREPFSSTEIHLVCPCHAHGYDLETAQWSCSTAPFSPTV